MLDIDADSRLVETEVAAVRFTFVLTLDHIIFRCLTTDAATGVKGQAYGSAPSQVKTNCKHETGRTCNNTSFISNSTELD